MDTRTRRAVWRWRRFPALVLSLLAAVSMLAASALPVQATPQTIRVSVDAGGAEGNGLSSLPAISADGRYVAYRSAATNLVTPDANSTIPDIYVWDRLTGQVSRASVASDGTQANGNSSTPAISADGCVVVFQSTATNLVAGVSGTQIYARDRCAGTTELVSAADGTATTAGNGVSSRPSISDDGRYVVFSSLASNLVAGDTNGVQDVFVRDRVAQTTTRVSVSSTGAQLAVSSDGGAISGDGTWVAFHTADATVVGGLNGASQVFVRQRTSASSVEVVSKDSAGTIGNGASSFASLSRDGSRVAFRSQATNLVAGDTNGVQDIFVRDRAAGTTRRVSVASDGSQANAQASNASISANGQVVVFQSTATNLVAGDVNGRQDVFAHMLSTGVTELVSVSSSGTQANLDSFVVDGMAPALSGDGQYVVFYSGASNLVSGDTNGVIDVFLRQRDTTDTTPPQVTSSVSGTQGSNGWYVSDVTVTWAVSDPESGIASSTGCGTTTITTDGTTTLTCSATNGAGLTTNQSVTVKRDTTAPTTTASASPAANANGWHNTNVTVTLSASDATSGVWQTQYRVDGGALQTYTGPFIVAGDGTHTVEYFSRDNAGNVEATRSLSVRIDATPPSVTASVSGTAGQNGWYVSNVIVTASGADAGSGIEPGSCTSVTITTEGSSQPATVTCRDLAGNTGSASVSVSIDTTAPTTTASASPAANANGWNNTNVTVTLSASDATSGVKEVTYSATGAQVIAPTTVSGASATINLTAEGGTTITFFARDNAGNVEVAKTATVKIDKTPPVVTASRTPGPNANGWNNTDVTVTGAGTDGLSGIDAATCTTVVVSTEGAGQSATVACQDRAGNTGQATVSDINIDKTAPVVSVQGPTDLNEGASGTWHADAQDGLSGVDSIAWDLDNDGSFADASGPSASRSFGDDAALPIRARATDKAGNAAVGSLAVIVHNVAPTANAGPPQTVTEGAAVTLSGSASDPGADTHTFVWDFGDGSATATGQTVTHTYTAPGEYTVTLTVTDDDGGVGTATTTVTVRGSLGTLGRFVAFSSELTWLRQGVKVLSGDVGANGARSGPGRERRDDDDDDDDHGPSRDRTAEVILGAHVRMLDDLSRVVGDTVWLRNGVEVFNVIYNELVKHRRATIHGTQTEGLALPVLTLPALPAITPGTQDVEVRRNQTLTLAPGAYRKITVQQGATLILNGVYHIATLDVRNQGKVYFRGRSELRVKNEMDTDHQAYIGPDPAIGGLRAADIVIYVEGGDDRRGPGARDEEVGPTVVQIGTRNTIRANIYAPNGTVWLKNDTKATGAFIGKRVRIGEDVELTLDSAF